MNDDIISVVRDTARLAAVRATGLLDTENEEAFDRLTRLAARLIDVPTAFISLVDETRDFYKSACGFGDPLASAREIAGLTFCHYTIQSDQPLVIPDTVADARYRDVPTVESLGIAAYIGVPLIIKGQVIGAFCASDTTPHAWTEHDVSTLTDLAAITITEIELRAATRRSEAGRMSAELSAHDAVRSLARMDDLFRKAPAFIAVLRGPSHVFELANDRYMQLVGHRDIIGKSAIAALPEIEGQGFIELLDGVLGTGVPFAGHDMPVRLQRTPNGELEDSFVTFGFQAIVEIDDTRSGIFVTGMDVTASVLARREIEAMNLQLQDQATELEMQAEELQASTEALQTSADELIVRTAAAEAARDEAMHEAAARAASDARYRLLAEAVPVQVWTARPDGSLDFVSEQTARYFGVSAEQLLSDGWINFIHPEDRTRTIDRWIAALKSEAPYEVDFRCLDGNTGEYRWHLGRALPHRDTIGAVVGWIGSNTDVHDERLARADAETANHSKSEFLAVMSHELRTPLNAIGGYAEIMEMELRGPVTDAQRHDLDRIQRSQRHLLGLISGILDYAKIDAGMMQFDLEDAAVDEILSTCEALTLPQAVKGGISLTYPASTALKIRVDREKAQQVLLNLLSNAIKFTESGGRIVVTCIADEGAVLISVADTGRGIPVDQLERVFEPFVQVDAKFTREQSGTGLGLAISRDLTRDMGGDLWGTSTLGVGSTFTARFPAV